RRPWCLGRTPEGLGYALDPRCRSRAPGLVGGCIAGRMTKAHHVIVMGLNILGYSEGVPSMLLRNTPSMVSGMSVMKTSASALAPGTASTSRSIHSLLTSTHAE